MQAKLILEGIEYEMELEETNNNKTAEEIADILYGYTDKMQKFQVKTDKGFIVLGEQMLKKAYFLISD